MKTAKARFSYGTGRIIVDECPYCHKTHYHNLPVGESKRMADCFQGEYVLDFNETPNKGLRPTAAGVESAGENSESGGG